ncbi:Gfo/Idh/MocA family protein [Haladaptatus salinisoli]|uniref:Gfo/Idh/MocA family protein n=1 Tax=Haladaptatus salinisoli TaxID=2884876 RepID=UPI001D09EB8A|nr:Gfo/Idh/MocA family oxidoreductase [Haladaptatus salinisoli]
MTRVAVIGTGFMGENHARAASEHPTLELDAVVDINASRANAIAERYDANRAETEYSEVFDVDAVIVATPETVHAEQANAILDHEIHLLLEKPITESIDEAIALAERETRTDMVTGVSFVLRYDPAYAAVREAVTTGELGDVVAVRAKRGITIEESRRIGARGHPLYYMNIHDIDAMLWSTQGRVVRVTSIARRGELSDIDVPDATQSLLEFEDGAIGVLEGYGTLPSETPGRIEAAFEIVGTNGKASVETPGDTLTVHGDRYDHPDSRHWPIVNDRIDGTVRRQIDRFAEAIDGNGEMLATIKDGARAQAVANAAKEAYESNTAVSVKYP